MTEVAALLAAFYEATGRATAVWERREGAVATLLGASPASFGAYTASGVDACDVPQWAQSHGVIAQRVSAGASAGWLFAEPHATPACEQLLGRVISVVHRLQHERDNVAQSLSERVDELNLLYAIGELLGNGVAVEDVAETLLHELADTLGATRALLYLPRGQSVVLTPVATLGTPLSDAPRVSLDDDSHLAVRAWRAEGSCVDEFGVSGEPVLAVAITRPSSGLGITGQYPIVTARRPDTVTVTGGGIPLGVIVLSGRSADAAFTTSHRSLGTAVGRQIGVAMHNMSLVRAAVERQHSEREMRLAHDLQLKLLPKPAIVGPEARAAARVVPADSVGGDFYLLARLDRDRTGVLIGDVSGHGYPSALVMALALSAAAIHVQAAFDPAIALDAVQRSLAEELQSTEMSLTLCYAVIDARARELRFANAGHPHAFRLGADGQCERLRAIAPPIGFSDAPIEECVMSWRPGDRLVLLTDGVVDAVDRHGRRLGEAKVLEILSGMRHGQSPDDILRTVFDRVRAHADDTPLRDDQAVVVVDRA